MSSDTPKNLKMTIFDFAKLSLIRTLLKNLIGRPKIIHGCQGILIEDFTWLVSKPNGTYHWLCPCQKLRKKDLNLTFTVFQKGICFSAFPRKKKSWTKEKSSTGPSFHLNSICFLHQYYKLPIFRVHKYQVIWLSLVDSTKPLKDEL